MMTKTGDQNQKQNKTQPAVVGLGEVTMLFASKQYTPIVLLSV